MLPFRRLATSSFTVLALLLAFSSGRPTPAHEVDAPKTVANRALLIGCTHYDDPIEELWGPERDVRLLAATLRENYGFKDANIHQLAGWPEDVRNRPTYANIVAAFKRLIAEVKSGDQVVIQMNGHGLQVPEVEGVDFEEADGKDEVFLPSDVEPWNGAELANAIRDDQIDKWLAQLRERGANVWIIFDCCHSGTLTKGGERMRGAKPDELNIPADLIRETEQRVAKKRSQSAKRFLDANPNQPAEKYDTNQGKIIAFYACQPFEETPELPRPAGVAHNRANYHGLLTYTIVEVLKQATGPISYNELMRRVVNSYRAERKTRGPTPFAEGDTELEVLGTGQWSRTPEIRLRRIGKTLVLDAGALRGLSANSVLAVYGPDSDPEDDVVLGHVCVTSTTLLESAVIPCVWRSAKKPSLDTMKSDSICRIVDIPMGDWRIRLSVDNSDATPEDRMRFQRAIAAIPKEVSELVDVTRDAPPDFTIKIESGNAVLSVITASTKSSSRVIQRYSLTDEKVLSSQLSHDLRKIFRWHSVWRIAESPSVGLHEVSGVSATLRVVALEIKDGKVVGTRPLQRGVLSPREPIGVGIDNMHGRSDIWVSILFLDAGFGITEVTSGQVQRRRAMRPIPFMVDGSSFGVEGFVAFAVSQKQFKDQPPFAHLAQGPINNRIDDMGKKGANTPARLSAIMDMIDGSKGESSDFHSLAAPAVFAHSWVTVPGVTSP